MSVSIFEDDASMPSSIKKAVAEALPAFISSENEKEVFDNALRIAAAFGDESDFSRLTGEKSSSRDEAESLITAGFRRNIGLLVQKTWVEKSDEAMKEEVLFRIDGLCKNLAECKYRKALKDFLPVLQDTVYLLFGSAAREPGFLEYAVRIDPDFGFFWHYINSLEGADNWSEEKSRAAVFLGVCFLANF